MSYVCAFRGRRDGYEVPLALAESGRLERFITDYYGTSPVAPLARLLPSRLREKLALRVKAGIPADRVECLLGSTLLEALLIRAGRSPSETFMTFDLRYSREAAAVARRERSDLFLYAPYAMPAFREHYDHSPLKVMFQFHPHADLERRILAEDRDAWRSKGVEFTERLAFNVVPREEPEYERGWSYADHIVCASTFTKRSLQEVGADPSRISVIPYGIDVPAPSNQAMAATGAFHALFVGSGMQRKGLHHLFAAWRQADLPAGARLTVVARVIEPVLARLAEQTPGVTLRSDVSSDELDRLYRDASLFCMPSLVEGFGQVYLEALSHGVPVLGSANTGLPDLGGEDDGVFVVEAGNVDALAAKLAFLAGHIPGNQGLREAARRCAMRFTWPEFRRKIAQLLQSLEATR